MGPVDPQNPWFADWLVDGYERARGMVSEVNDLDGVIALLSFYTSGFHDGHLGWGPSYVRRTVRWPEFVVARRGSDFVVHHAETGAEGPPVGARLLSCDGVAAARLLEERVMPFKHGIPSLEASRARLAPQLLIDDGNPWNPPVKQCRFETGDRTVRRPIKWRSVPLAEVQPHLEAAAFGTPPDRYEVRRPAQGVAWVTIPSFAENLDDNRAGLESVIEALPSLRSERWIVLDVRGNRGGNSTWGRLVAEALWGEPYIARIREGLGGAYTVWRASEANADFVERYSVPRYEPGSARRTALEDLVTGLRGSVAAGHVLYPSEESEAGDATAMSSSARPSPGPSPIDAGVVLLTDGWCASACLGFVDLILASPSVRHAGAATYADAIYIDNRSITLPSGLGRFGFSMKVWRDRARGHNQPYEPDLPYEGAEWSTAALEPWLLEALEH